MREIPEQVTDVTAPKPPPFSIRLADWRLDRLAIQCIREEVFIRELHIPPGLEWDGRDSSAIHLLAEDSEGQPIGTARMLPEGHIGRMAILPSWRRSGVGSALMEALLEIAAQRHLGSVFLQAQQIVTPFYQGIGFEPEGPVYMEEGIPYQLMARPLDSEPLSETAYREPHYRVDESLELIDRGILGETRDAIPLHSREAFRTACLSLARQARRSIRIFSHDLDASIYDNKSLVNELKRLATRNPDPSIFILLQSNEKVQREGHGVVTLAARLPSKIQIFRPLAESRREPTDSFMLADDIAFVYRKWHTRFDGRVEFYNLSRARELVNAFQELWNESEEDIALRRLSI